MIPLCTSREKVPSVRWDLSNAGMCGSIPRSCARASSASRPNH